MATIQELQREVDEAQARLDSAKADADAARHAEYVEGLRQRIEASKAVNLFSENPSHQGVAPYILPLGEGYADVNPLDPESFPFGGPDWLRGSVVYVMSKPERTRPTRVFISSGLCGESWNIGNSWTCRHDQTGRKLGTYTVVGIVLYDADGQVLRTEGEVPNRKLSGAVFK